jgi:hypothetical protein
MKWCLLIGLFFIVATGWAVHGCAGRQEQDSSLTEASAQEPLDEPAFTMGGFSVSPKASFGGVIPYLAEGPGDVSEKTCYVPVKKPQVWKTQNPIVLEKINTHKAEIQSAVVNWAREKLYPNQDYNFHVSLESPFIRHVPLEDLKLSPEQDCITDPSTPFAPETKTITTQFGAKEMTFESHAPNFTQSDFKKLIPKAQAAKCRLKGQPWQYSMAQDEKGKPLKDEKKRPQFKGPAGELLLKKDIPSMAKRPVLSWTLICKEPLFFALGDLPPDAWSSEADPAKCSVNLIYWDKTPRPLDCSELSDVGFGVQEIPGDNEVLVKAKADGQTATQKMKYNERQSMLVAGRILLWVTPKKIVEGALLQVDSFALAPNSGDKTQLEAW